MEKSANKYNSIFWGPGLLKRSAERDHRLEINNQILKRSLHWLIFIGRWGHKFATSYSYQLNLFPGPFSNSLNLNDS